MSRHRIISKLDKFYKNFNRSTISESLRSHLLKQNLPPQITFETIKLRTLRDMLDKFDLTLEDCDMLLNVCESLNLTPDHIDRLRSQIYIHPDCSEDLYKYLHVIKFTREEFLIVNHFFSRDDHDEKDVMSFTDILDKYASCDEELAHALNRIFAVDGFSKNIEYKYYVKNLKYTYEDNDSNKPIDYAFIHVRAVRYLYDKYGLSVTPLKLHEALLNLLNPDIVKSALMQDYLSFAGHMYKNLLKIIQQKMELEIKSITNINEEDKHSETKDEEYSEENNKELNEEMKRREEMSRTLDSIKKQ